MISDTNIQIFTDSTLSKIHGVSFRELGIIIKNLIIRFFPKFPLSDVSTLIQDQPQTTHSSTLPTFHHSENEKTL